MTVNAPATNMFSKKKEEPKRDEKKEKMKRDLFGGIEATKDDSDDEKKKEPEKVEIVNEMNLLDFDSGPSTTPSNNIGGGAVDLLGGSTNDANQGVVDLLGSMGSTNQMS